MNIFYWITLALVLYATYGSFRLSLNDWKIKNVCPKIAGIPACYIVFVCFFTASICHIINTAFSIQLFFISIFIPALIAFIGTVTELSGTTICPKTKSGIPMCYISLGFCVVLLITKFFSL